MTDNSRVRVSIVGVVIVAMFASLLARLWFLQVGPEQDLRVDTGSLTTRVVQTEAPRGRILDRNGAVLVQDRAAWAVSVDRNLDEETLTRVLGQLSEQLGIPVAQLRERYESPRQSVLKPAVVATGVPLEQQLSLLERQQDYPGVHVEQLTVRTYPAASEYEADGLAAHVLGYVGEIDADQLEQLKDEGYQLGNHIGRDGIEAAYESDLRGRPEKVTVQVDPRGRQIGAPIEVEPGVAGNDVVLTIDARIQRAAEIALAEGMEAARNHDEPRIDYPLNAPGGSVVVLDVTDGSVVAMASEPTYPLSWWIGGITQERFGYLSSPLANNPLVNRVTEGQYAPGSTYKLVTALAMTRFGIRGAFEPFYDSGSVEIGDREFENDNGASNGSVALADAIKVSSDTYFYTVGSGFWQAWNAGDLQRGLGLQQEATDLGFGSSTGIEVGELQGRVPDPVWKEAFAQSYYETEEQRQQASIWYPGDEVNLAVGQQDVLVTPLQLAAAYACFASGGTLQTPHLGVRVDDPVTKKALRTVDPEPKATMQFDAATWDQMRRGFEAVVADERGTAYSAFRGFPLDLVPVAGKTGTAQVDGKAPTSLFAAYFPANAPKYVVLAVIEEGGYGSTTAAPIVRRVIEGIMDPDNAARAAKPITPTSQGRD